MWEALCTVQPAHGVEVLDSGHCPSFVFDGIQLASAYNPEREAAMQAHKIYKDFDDVYIYGVGAGYIPRYLIEECKHKIARIHVYILNKSLFLGMLSIVDQSDWLEDDRVVLHLPTSDSVPVLPFAVTTPCIYLPDDEAKSLCKALHLELNLNYEMNRRWKSKNDTVIEQVKQNVELMRSDGCVSELFGLLKSGSDEERKAVVVGSGPSLDTVMDKVRQLSAQGAKVIATSSALNSLLSSGVRPDVVIMLDAIKQFMMGHLSGDLGSLRNTVLVYFPVVHNDVLKLWPYKRLVAYGGDMSFFGDVCTGIKKESLFIGGSVIHPALDLAVRMGADEVYLAGADLSYTYGKTHAQGNLQSQEAEYDPSLVETPKVKNGWGKNNDTEHNFLLYLRGIETYIQKVENVTFINLSRDGAFIAGTVYEKVE